MNEIEIVKTLMKAKGKSGAYIANELGMNTPSAVSNRLQSKTITVEVLLKILSVLECDLIIKAKTGDKETFIVENENRQSVKIYGKNNKKGGDE